VIGPALISGIDTFLPPAGTLMSASWLWQRNWKERSSTPSPVLSIWMR